jgi:apolipoprotein N-acyltransferase
MAEDYLALTKKAVDDGAKLVVWPETALPVYLLGGQYEPVVRMIKDFVDQNKIMLLTGMPDIIYYKEEDKLPFDVKYSEYLGNYATFNGVLLFQPDKDTVMRYGKMKLVPFGERVPFVDLFPFLGDIIKWGVGLSGWNVGQDTSVFKLPLEENGESKDSLRINGLVCYESIYPFFVAEFVNRGANVISVITNDSWYGNLSGPYQHKEIAVLRAVENRRSVIRAANGGISALINPLGVTEKETRMLTRDVITGDVVIQEEETIFTRTRLLIPTISMVFSFWIFGIWILKKLQKKFNNEKKSRFKI